MARPGSIADDGPKADGRVPEERGALPEARLVPRAHWRGYDALAICLSGLIALAAFALTYHFEEQSSIERLHRAADERRQLARSELRDQITALESIRALWYSSNEVEREEFEAFAVQHRESYPLLLAIEWLPVVEAGEIAALELEAREDVPDFQVHELSVDGRCVPATPREVHYPVLYAEPALELPDRLGFDRGSTPEQRRALELAASEGKPQTSGPCAWRGNPNRAIFTTALPVYDRPGLPPPGERRTALRGFVVGIFDLEKLVEHALAKAALKPVAIQVVDATRGLELLRLPATARRATIPPEVSYPLSWGGTTWTVTCQRFENSARHALSGLWLGFSMIFTALLALYLRSGQERALLLAHSNVELFTAEAKSREAERMLGTLLSNLPGLAYRCRNDREWSMEFVSDGCLALTGYESAELLSGAVTFGGQVIHPDDRERVWQQVQHRLDVRQPFQLVYRIETKTGETRWVWEQGRGIYGEDGGLEALEGFISDITAQKNTEHALRKEKYFSETALDSLPGVFYLFDSQGHYLRWNKNLEEVTGFGRAEIERMHPRQMVAPEDRALVEARIEEVFEQGFATAEAHFMTKDGRRVPYFFTGRRVDIDGRLCLLGMGVDVTDRVRAEEERRAIQDKALKTQKLESIGLLAGGIAHDFNNLLTAILGNLKFARDRVPPGHAAREFLDSVGQATERARGLTQQLLAYSGRAPFERLPIDLSDHIGEIAHLLTAAISKKVTLALELDRDLPAVEADAVQIQQIAMNLVLNGAEACGDQPGAVRVRTETRTLEAGQVRDPQGRPLPPGRYVSLVVEDTGCGMDEETRARIFDPFFTTKFTGRGLGLSAVLGIVRTHGGALQVRSRPGHGSTFEVLLPASLQRRRRRREAPPRDLTGQGLILAADDEPQVLQMIVQSLSECGYEVLTARDGRAALELFRRRAMEVDLVLLDMTMPEMSGSEVLAAIHALRPLVPAILCSGYDEKEATKHLFGAGLTSFLQKPFSPEALAAKVKETLAAARSPST
jgi:PAS domain S-box-containing protein